MLLLLFPLHLAKARSLPTRPLGWESGRQAQSKLSTGFIFLNPRGKRLVDLW